MPVNDYWRSGIQLSESRDDENHSRRPVPTITIHVCVKRAGRTLFSYSNHELVAGAEFQQDEVNSNINSTKPAEK